MQIFNIATFFFFFCRKQFKYGDRGIAMIDLSFILLIWSFRYFFRELLVNLQNSMQRYRKFNFF